MRIQVIFGLFIASSFKRVVCSQIEIAPTIPPECLVAGFKADVEKMVQDVDPSKPYKEVVDKYMHVWERYEEWWNTVASEKKCIGEHWSNAHGWVVNAKENAIEDLNEILSKSQGWVNAYGDAKNLVNPLAPVSEGITSETEVKSWLNYFPEVEDRATEYCKAACKEWRDKVERALKDIPTSGEENLIKYVEAMRGFQILANRMLPLKCMGNEENLANSTKFVFLTLRELHKNKWEETWERIVFPKEAGNALVSAHTP